MPTSTLKTIGVKEARAAVKAWRPAKGEMRRDAARLLSAFAPEDADFAASLTAALHGKLITASGAIDAATRPATRPRRGRRGHPRGARRCRDSIPGFDRVRLT